MARRAPGQGAYGVRQGTTRVTSGYGAPVFNRGAGSELMGLAKGFAGLSQGLQAMEVRSRQDDAAEAKRLAAEQAAEAKRMAELDKEVSEQLAPLVDEVGMMRREGASDAEVREFIRANTTQPVSRAMDRYDEETFGDMDADDFIGAHLRNPRLLNSVNESQGVYAAESALEGRRSTLQDELAQMFSLGAQAGKTDMEIFAEFANGETYKEIL